MSGANYKPSPVGEATPVPWLNKPDTKYNAEGVYKLSLAVEGQEAQDLAADLSAQAEAAFEAMMEEKKNPSKKGVKPLTKAEAEKWSVYYPFDNETDDDGKETGRIIFHFKQNAKIRQPDGGMKKILIGIRDSANNEVKPPPAIFSGSKLAALYKPRAISVAGAKQAGVKLDFCMVQIIELAKGNGGSKGFGVREGGFVAGGEHQTNDEGSEEAEY